MRATQWGLMIMFGAAAAFAAPEPATADQGDPRYYSGSPQAGARIWLDGEPSYYRRGQRLNVRYSVPYDSYVAIVHIDTDGYIDFLYPAGPWDEMFVRGGRTYSLPIRGSFASTTIRSRPGIGYVYIIASPTPLDFRYFQGGVGSSWDWNYAGRNVYGDPFLALEQVTRFLLPRWPYSPYVYDYHSYYVEGLHRYPSYACSDRYYGYGWGWSPGFGSCDRIDIFLTDYPYYYDTGRFRGDRRIYLRQYDRIDPKYGYKENPETSRGFAAPRGAVPRGASPAVSRDGQGGTSGSTIPRREAIPAQGSSGSNDGRDAAPRQAPAATGRDREPVGRSAPELQPRTPSDSRAPAPEPSTGARARPVPAGRGSADGGGAAPDDRAPSRGGRP